MNKEAVIKAENLSKQYRLGAIGTGTLSHDVNRWWARLRGKEDPFLKVGEVNDRSQKGSSDYVWSLRDINFEVKQGEVLGIIGKNGAGKSTLLKILSQVTTPTTGSVKIKGRIASLLEVGTGFHPELTGRENIFLNGAILGMTKAEIRSKFDEIVAFSGVERYIDTPVKRYSSGMYVRLAFAVAAHLEPEILIVDEVLAVGDAEFQDKCLGKMKDVSNEGRTVLFVSHNMGAIKGLCSRCILLKNGSIVDDGNPVKVVSSYFKGTNESGGKFTIGKEDKAEALIIETVLLKNQKGEQTQDFEFGDDLTIEVEYYAPDELQKPYFWIGVRSKFGGLFGANGLIDGYRPSVLNGRGKLSVTFKNLNLLPQTYSILLGARDAGGNQFITKSKEAGYFNIITKLSDIGFNGALADTLAVDSSPLLIDYTWDFGKGEVYEVKANSYAKQ